MKQGGRKARRTLSPSETDVDLEEVSEGERLPPRWAVGVWALFIVGAGAACGAIVSVPGGQIEGNTWAALAAASGAGLGFVAGPFVLPHFPKHQFRPILGGAALYGLVYVIALAVTGSGDNSQSNSGGAGLVWFIVSLICVVPMFVTALVGSALWNAFDSRRLRLLKDEHQAPSDPNSADRGSVGTSH